MLRLPMLSVAQIAADRILLRTAWNADREGLIELQTDPQVRAHLGGPRPREAVGQYLDAIGPANAAALSGVIVIADKVSDDLIGTLVLGRRAAELPGHVTEDGGELELSYVLRRSAWGLVWRSRLPLPCCAPLRTSSLTSRSSSLLRQRMSAP